FHAQSGAPSARPSKADKKAAREPILEPVAVSTSPLALPFKRAWQHLTEAALALQPTLDGAHIYLPLAGGRVFCLDPDSGALLWSSQPGGTISAPIGAGGSMGYIATRKLAADGGEAGASLLAVDQSTGLTKWAKDYPREFTSPIAVGGDRLYAGSADGAFYALDGADGSVVWK